MTKKYIKNKIICFRSGLRLVYRWGAHDASPDPVVGWGGDTPPQTSPCTQRLHSCPRALSSAPSILATAPAQAWCTSDALGLRLATALHTTLYKNIT